MRLALVLGLLTATTAFACPNLEGYYKECRDQYGWFSASDMTVTQSIAADVTTYNFSTSRNPGYVTEGEVKADGKTITTQIIDGVTMDNTFTCKGNALEMTETFFWDGQVFTSFTSSTTKVGAKLVIKKTYFRDGETHSIVEVCE